MYFIKEILLPQAGPGPPAMMANMPDVGALMAPLQEMPPILTP